MKAAIIPRVNWRSLVCCCILLLVSAILYKESDYLQVAAQRTFVAAHTENVDASPGKVTSTKAEDASNKNRAPSDVILITYMRSGSTFVGKMLGHLNDSFYWYEPLWVGNKWTFYREDGKVCDYAKPVCQENTTSLENSLRFLRDIYNCSLRNHVAQLMRMHSKSWAADSDMEWPVFSVDVSRRSLICFSILFLVVGVLYIDFGYWHEATRILMTSVQTEDEDANRGKVTSIQTDDVNNKKSAPWDVILVAYMRSGSSFLGELLGHRDDSFYWYEPLWKNNNWIFYREDGQVCDSLWPECQEKCLTDVNSMQHASITERFHSVGQASKSTENVLRFLSDIYNCSLRNHGGSVASNIHAASWSGGPSWQEYRTCRKSNWSKKHCLAKLEPTCQTKSHRVIKVLRIDFAYTLNFLRTHPRLKAVLLLRDPRGILNSHIKTQWFPLNETNPGLLKASAGVFCSRIARDINAAKNLSNQFKDRVKIVQYEDFEDPRKLDILYNFLGMSIPVTPIQTQSEKVHGIFSYRIALPWQVVQTIDKECAHVYHELGLVAYRDENHLRDLNQSAIENTLPYALVTT